MMPGTSSDRKKRQADAVVILYWGLFKSSFLPALGMPMYVPMEIGNSVNNQGFISFFRLYAPIDLIFDSSFIET